MMIQPTKPKSITNSRTPKVALKKASSRPKKACPKNIALIPKYGVKAKTATIGDISDVRFT